MHFLVDVTNVRQTVPTTPDEPTDKPNMQTPSVPYYQAALAVAQAFDALRRPTRTNTPQLAINLVEALRQALTLSAQEQMNQAPAWEGINIHKGSPFPPGHMGCRITSEHVLTEAQRKAVRETLARNPDLVAQAMGRAMRNTATTPQMQGLAALLTKPPGVDIMQIHVHGEPKPKLAELLKGKGFVQVAPGVFQRDALTTDLENDDLAEEIRAWIAKHPDDVATKAPTAKEMDRVVRALERANDLLRSVFAIAQRDGKETNWGGLRFQVEKLLLEQHKILWPTDQQNSPVDLAGRKLYPAPQPPQVTKCSGCGTFWPTDNLRPTVQTAPEGEQQPAGRCPACDGLCYLTMDPASKPVPQPDDTITRLDKELSQFPGFDPTKHVESAPAQGQPRYEDLLHVQQRQAKTIDPATAYSLGSARFDPKDYTAAPRLHAEVAGNKLLTHWFFKGYYDTAARWFADLCKAPRNGHPIPVPEGLPVDDEEAKDVLDALARNLAGKGNVLQIAREAGTTLQNAQRCLDLLDKAQAVGFEFPQDAESGNYTVTSWGTFLANNRTPQA